jgi:hypothetical protein
MEYIVTTDKKICGKINGEKLTADDIIANGGKVERLLSAGFIKEAPKTPKAVKEVQEVQEVQESETSVFNTYNYEGDK